MRSFFSISLFLLSVSSPSAQWIAGGRTQQSISVSDAYFVDAEEGWIVGSMGKILHTANRGAEWEPQTSGTKRSLNGAFFVNSSEGWVVGDQGIVLHTSDGGQHWRPQPSRMKDALLGVWFVDAEEGWIVGARGTILHTSNGGNAWWAQSSGIGERLYDVFFVDERRGWIVGMHVLHTQNGGKTWRAQELPETVFDLRRVHFFDDREGWIVGGRGTIWHTADAGAHWTVQMSGTRNTLQDVCFVTRYEGWAVGPRTILHTDDGGESWTSQAGVLDVPGADRMNFVRMFFEDRFSGLFVDRRGGMLRFSDMTDLTIPTDLIAKKLYVIGGGTAEQHPWSTAGTSANMDLGSTPGWLEPGQITGQNQAFRILQDGDIWSSRQSLARSDQEALLSLCDGETDYGYRLPVRDPVTVYFDIGGSLGINRILVWFPGAQFFRFQHVEVGVNDGDPGNVDGRGWPLLSPVWSGDVEQQLFASVTFPTEPVRYIGVTVSDTDTMGISEIMVYGEGYVPSASFVSHVIDFGDLASWGRIRWHVEKGADARVLVRTRSGSTEEPNIHWRHIGIGRSRRLTCLSEETGERLTREEYDALSEEAKAGITTNLEHWSSWSAPYDLEEGRTGVSIVSPEPRRYFQVRVDIQNSIRHTGKVDYVAFEYSCPPPAHELLGEIHPVEVKPAEVTTFVYSIKPTILGDDMGFDSLEILTPVPVDRIRAVRVDGEDIAFTFEFLTDPTRFAVHFRHFDVRDSWGLLEVVFDSVVLRYGTEFVGQVYDSTSDLVDQTVVAGDVREDFDGNEITVNTELDAPLIESVEVVPNPFTPNGDGINDEATISYALLKLTDVAGVTVDLYHLPGSHVRRLYEGQDSEGLYAHRWDGRDREGGTVPPGIYLYRISVCADAGRQVRMRTVVVAY